MENCNIVECYTPLLFVGYLSQENEAESESETESSDENGVETQKNPLDRLVIVERPWSHVLKELPEPMWRPKYAT